MRRGPIERIVIYLIAAGFTVFAAFPVLWALNISLKSERDVLTRHLDLIPHPATLSNYVAIWTQSNLPDLMWNSAVTTGFTVAICVVAGTMAASGSGLQWSTIRNMAMAWVLTLPAAMLIAGSLYLAGEVLRLNREVPD